MPIKRKYYLQQLEYRKKPENREGINKTNRKWRWKVRCETISHYGKECICCGELNMKFLTIDHIKGGGNKHRREINNGGVQSGYLMYAWLRKNNYPKGFQTMCMNCNWARQHNNGICPHKEEVNESAR